jgi:hypothetical protein
MEQEYINIYNLYEQVTYIHDTIDNCLVVSWDDRNPIINKLMVNEAFFFNDIKQSLSSHYWVDEIKKVSEWSPGETIHLMILNIIVEKSPMKIFWSKDISQTYRYEKINEDGYLYVNWYDDQAQLSNMVKKDCLYNREWELINEYPYVLK